MQCYGLGIYYSLGFLLVCGAFGLCYFSLGDIPAVSVEEQRCARCTVSVWRQVCFARDPEIVHESTSEAGEPPYMHELAAHLSHMQGLLRVFAGSVTVGGVIVAAVQISGPGFSIPAHEAESQMAPQSDSCVSDLVGLNR